MTLRVNSSLNGKLGIPNGDMLTVSQKARNLSTRRSGGLPAISAEFSAPIEIV